MWVMTLFKYETGFLGLKSLASFSKCFRWKERGQGENRIIKSGSERVKFGTFLFIFWEVKLWELQLSINHFIIKLERRGKRTEKPNFKPFYRFQRHWTQDKKSWRISFLLSPSTKPLLFLPWWGKGVGGCRDLVIILVARG